MIKFFECGQISVFCDVFMVVQSRRSQGLRALFLFKRMMMFLTKVLEQSLQSMRGCLKGMWMIEHGREVLTVMLGVIREKWKRNVLQKEEEHGIPSLWVVQGKLFASQKPNLYMISR